MLVAPLAIRRNRREAFTLLEVLVVVAIIVILASVAGVAVFRFLEEAKNDKATMDMQGLEKAYKAAVLKSGGEINSGNFNLQMLVPYMEQGSSAMYDPWLKPYQFRFIQSEAGDERIIFYTMDKTGQNELSWPRK